MKPFLLAAMLLAVGSVQADGLLAADDQTKWRAGIGAAFGDFEGNDGVIDDSQVGFSLFAGYQFNKWLGIEGGYMNTGDFKGNLDTAGQDDIEISFKGFQMAGVIYIPIGAEDISLFGKGGYYDFDTDLSQDGNITNTGHQDGAFGGGGAVINIAEDFGIRAEFDIYDIDDSDFWTAVIGFEYQFGRPK